MDVEQQNLPLFPTAAVPASDRDDQRRALDELFRLTLQYRSSQSYYDLLRFISRFRFYSPFNAMLVHLQMPGAKYVAPPHRWLRDYDRRIRPGARPLVLLQPNGPVMFTFDVSDTEPLEGAPPLPREVTEPFDVNGEMFGKQLEHTIENAKRDGIRVSLQKAGSQRAGSIKCAARGGFLNFAKRLMPTPEYVRIPIRYELLLNSDHKREIQYATLVHELAHLDCGHLGAPKPEWWWKDRCGLPEGACEFEAESVCYLVCKRLGIDTPSAEYLSGYTKQTHEVPAISLDCVMTASGLIEQMGRGRLKPRKEKKEG